MKLLSQALGIVALAFLLGMVVHKGGGDISRLAQKHSGTEFWVELARYCIRNLAGGGGSGVDTPAGGRP